MKRIESKKKKKKRDVYWRKLKTKTKNP